MTVAALGDSLTQGYGLPPEDGFVPQLQNWLDGQGLDAAITNAGVSGDTTAGGLARIGWTLTPETDALIVALGANDMLRGIDPAISRRNLDGILAEAANRNLPVLLVGIAASSNYGPDYKSEFDGMYPTLAETHGALVVTDMLAPLRDKPLSELSDWMQSDNIHPNAQGVALIVETLGPDVAALIERADP